MSHTEELELCLINYRDVIIPLLDKGEYRLAGRSLGNVVQGLGDIYEKSNNSRLNDTISGLMERLTSLQYTCLEDYPSKGKIETLKKIIQERNELVSSIARIM